jgi:Lrp/AsnC family leucine-responsive transcriptional regulator
VQLIQEVMECYLMNGEFDDLLRVSVSGTSAYERVHRNRLTLLPGVARVHSSFSLRTATEAMGLPLGGVGLGDGRAFAPYV